MIAAIVDLLGDLTRKVTDIEDTTIAISDELDEIEEDLDAIEDFIMDEDDDFEDYEEDELDWDDEDEDYEEGFDFGDEDSTIYEVECACGEIINFDEETLEEGSIVCDECGETLEFTFDDEDEEDEDMPSTRLEDRFIPHPALAIEQSRMTINNMAALSQKAV